MGVLIMKISDLMTILKTNNKHLISDAIIEKNPELLSVYNNNKNNYDLKFNMLYGKLNLLDSFENSDAIELSDALISILFDDNAYKYNKLFNTLSLEYDPIENYNRDETITTNYGNTMRTENYGLSKTSNIYGDAVTENENFKSAYNENDYSKDSKSVITDKTKTDTTTIDAKTDTVSESAHTDSIHNITKGNIGVTTSQQMIQSERDVANFVLYDIIFNDIIDSISTGVWCDD